MQEGRCANLGLLLLTQRKEHVQSWALFIHAEEMQFLVTQLTVAACFAFAHPEKPLVDRNYQQ